MKPLIALAHVIVSVGVLIGPAMAPSAATTRPAQVRRQGPLATMPSQPGPHIAKIKALGDNTWLDLGSPAADPKWGKARGRSWCPRMPYAPEFKAAFFYGEGVHGFAKPDGHYMDDLWAYDVNANRWICVYPGGNLKNLILKMDANGFEVDSDGQPIPLAQLSHAYEQVTYDIDRGRFMFMPCPGSANMPSWAERRKIWGGRNPANCSPWMYNAASGKFELLKMKGAVPESGYGDILEYVPSMKKAVFMRTGSRKVVWVYDPAANTWSKVATKGPPPTFGIDASACLDLKRDRIYVGGGYYPVAPGQSALWCFDLKTNSWIDLKPKGKPCGGSKRYGPDQAMMKYDAANDVVLLFYHMPRPGPEGRGIYVYDPATNSWAESPLTLPKEVCAAGDYVIRNHGFYNPELNAHFIYAAMDSDDRGTMWVYRYKRAAEKK